MDDLARRLCAALAGIESGAMLELAAARLLGEVAAPEAARALASLLAQRGPTADVRHALVGLCRALLPDSPLPAEQRAAIHRAAAADHHPAVVALFTTAAPALPPVGAKLGTARPPDDETLGHRTQRARSERSRDGMIRLGRDDDPAVIRNVLLNARMTEAGVVRIAARRPVPAAVLEEVARSRRWGDRPAIRRVLVQNPFTPTPIATALLPHLGAAELREVAEDPVVHPAVRAGARALLSARRPATSPPAE